jgi:hypothetical protein
VVGLVGVGLGTLLGPEETGPSFCCLDGFVSCFAVLVAGLGLFSWAGRICLCTCVSACVGVVGVVWFVF